MTVTHHKAEFAKNNVTGMWRVRCTACTWWERYGTEAEVASQFAVHDIEQWESAVPAEAAHAG